MFNETRLLDKVAYGSEFGEEFNTQVTTLRSGHERRNVNWSAPLGKYSISYAALEPEDHVLVYHAHMASFGSAIPFRFKDWSDFKASNEVIGSGTGAAQVLQLVKTYSFGPLDLQRKISKPVSVIVYEDDVINIASVDMVTGLVTITAAPGSVITWSGEFDVPVKFDEDRLDFRPIGRSSKNYLLSTNATLSEVRL